MDPRIPSRFLSCSSNNSSSSQVKSISVNRLKQNKLQRQQRCASVEGCIPSYAVENLLLSLQMYLTSSRMVSKLADEYYDSVEHLLTDEDRENIHKILELRQDVKAEVDDLDLALQNLLVKIQQSSNPSISSSSNI